MDYTENQRQSARAELARRELAKRGQSLESSLEMEEPDLSTHPLRDIMIGLTHAGRNLHNLPHDQVKSLEDIFSKLGSNFEGIVGPKFSEQRKEHKKISDYLPYDERDFGDIYGQKGEGNLLDKIIQGGVEHAPELATLGSLGRAALRRYPITQRMGGRRIRNAERIINELGANIPISEESIAAARPFLPNSHAAREMIQGSREGHYPSSFSLQSQVGHHERNLRSSPLASERLIAPEARDLKQTMLGEMESRLRSMEHIDPRYRHAADELRGGINDYRQYVRFRDNVWPLLRNIGFPVTALGIAGFGIKKAMKTLSSLTD